MADGIFRPSYHSPVYEPATYTTRNGKKLVRFRLPKTGKLVTGELLPNGKARVQSPLWYARIRKNGKHVRVPLGVADKEAALQLRAKLQLASDQQRGGMIDPYAEHRGTPLTQHIQDYQTHLEANGCSPDHITETINLFKRVPTLPSESETQSAYTLGERFIMNVSRDVITDLWSIYAAGEASADSVALIEEFLAKDDELATALKDDAVERLAVSRVPPLSPSIEARALNRTKRLLHPFNWLFFFAVLFTCFAFGRIISDTSWDVSPRNFILTAVIALCFWIAFFGRSVWLLQWTHRANLN